MQNRLIILLIALSVSLSCFAETCPEVNQIDVTHLPPGWTMLISPAPVDDQEYHFGKAIHSFNGDFYFKHVLCIYETCDSYFCPAFSLLSEVTYEHPDTVTKDWNQPAIIESTIMCAPANHDPGSCVFD